MFTYEVLSKSGERDHNEDYAGAASRGEAFCFVLCDGLGGHGGGEEASRLVACHILDDFKERGEVSEEYLKACFEESQELLMEEQKKQGREDEMKTTLVVLLADGNSLRWGHIGDSRLYYFKNKKLKKRTMDHSVPQMLAAAGEIREEEIRRHPDRNRLLRVMGIEWDLPKYKLEEPLAYEKNTAFLLCSDGFWEWTDEKAMQSALKKSKSPSEWLGLMEEDALKNGTGKGMDNYSAIAVFLREKGA